MHSYGYFLVHIGSILSKAFKYYFGIVTLRE